MHTVEISTCVTEVYANKIAVTYLLQHTESRAALGQPSIHLCKTLLGLIVLRESCKTLVHIAFRNRSSESTLSHFQYQKGETQAPWATYWTFPVSNTSVPFNVRQVRAAVIAGTMKTLSICIIRDRRYPRWMQITRKSFLSALETVACGTGIHEVGSISFLCVPCLREFFWILLTFNLISFDMVTP